MDDGYFDWDQNNVEHLRYVTPEEVEEAVLDPDRISAHAYNMGTEERWALLGATEEGAILFVVYTVREGKVRVITARDAESNERRRYRRRGK
jgi:uncharacterized DUF497 family protein